MNSNAISWSVFRALHRAKIFWSTGADFRSALLLALFSNHRSSALASKLNFGRGVQVRATGTPPIYIDLNSGDHQTIFREIFVERVYDLAAIPFCPQAVIDCGAHIGLFSRLATTAYPGIPIYAFEPNASNYDWLKKQCNFPTCGIKPIQAGVDVHGGTGLLFGDGCQGSIVPTQKKNSDGVEVKLVDLFAWIKNMPVVGRLLIKMDIEGKEFDLLPHILPVLPRTTALLFETHSFRGNSKELVETLKNTRFAVKEIRSRIGGGTTFSDFLAIRQ
jgi:FkbM family methyltransferase